MREPPMNPEQVRQHAAGMQKALDLRGDLMEPSSRFKSRVRAAAREAGVDVEMDRALDSIGRMVWQATVETNRGRASRTIFIDPAELEGHLHEEIARRVDAAWELAFQELGVLD